MNVLVTGGGGFLGRYIVEMHRQRGDSVRTYSRRRYDFLDELQVEQIEGDLRDEAKVIDACRDIDVVHHSGALAGIWGKWQDYYEINTLGTRYVIEGCRQHAVPKLIYTSSPSVTFACRPQVNVDESVGYADHFNCHYPKSKALAEQEVLEANDGARLLTCALRPHLIWGPRDQHLIPRLLDRARQGKLKRIGTGDNLIDIIYVENAAEAQLMAADHLSPDSPVAGSAYFLSQGQPVNCWDWINEILAMANLPQLGKGVPYGVAWAAGSVLETLYRLTGWTDEPRMTRFLAAQLATSHYFDITAAREDFGYYPSISTAEGMRRLQEWMNSSSLPVG